MSVNKFKIDVVVHIYCIFSRIIYYMLMTENPCQIFFLIDLSKFNYETVLRELIHKSIQNEASL